MRTEPKSFKAYDQQVALLVHRGMEVADADDAVEVLRRVSYYRLSGYWYPFRMAKADGRSRSDRFIAGTTFDEVVALYDFDARLRSSVFAALAPIELTFRALIGHELGRIDPFAHLLPELLGPVARAQNSQSPSHRFSRWRAAYEREVRSSHEDFVAHHQANHGGAIPIWAAVELMDWGMLTHFFAMAPERARTAVAGHLRLSSPQLESWLKSLNVLRNIAAHHGRMFNRVYSLQPKLPRGDACPEVTRHSAVMNRAFGQLTLVQYLLTNLSIGNSKLLPTTLGTFPTVDRIPREHLGAPHDWRYVELWS